MHDDEITGPDPARPRRWTPDPQVRRRGPPPPARAGPGPATIAISVACPTPGCPGRLRFGATGEGEGLTSECASCRQPFALVAGEVAHRGASGGPEGADRAR
jgi:hypothetical protein